jgi:hypothetical protein
MFKKNPKRIRYAQIKKNELLEYLVSKASTRMSEVSRQRSTHTELIMLRQMIT